MTKTTFLGYVPSLKSKHEATIVNGRAMKSKGGSIRYLLEGEYDGRKTLPKTVSKEDFVKVYGFDAKEAEAVIISGTKGDKRWESRLHIVGDKDGDGFTPKEIRDFDTNKLTPMETKISKRVSDNYDADTVGSPSPADPLNPLHLPRNHSRKNRQMKTFQPKMKKKFGNIMFMFPIHLLMIFSLLMMQEILELKKGQSKRHMKFQRIKEAKVKWSMLLPKNEKWT